MVILAQTLHYIGQISFMVRSDPATYAFNKYLGSKPWCGGLDPSSGCETSGLEFIGGCYYHLCIGDYNDNYDTI